MLGCGRFTQNLTKTANKTHRSRNCDYVMRNKWRTLATAFRRCFESASQSRRRIFDDIYRYKQWGDDGRSDYFSGSGSRGLPVNYYVENIVPLLRMHQAELGRPLHLVDLGCGDFVVGKALTDKLPNANYIGCDIVPDLIRAHQQTHGTDRISFQLLDIAEDPLPHGDVCLIRQVLQHISNAEIKKVLAKLSYSYVYVTEGLPTKPMGTPNPDKRTGADVRFDWQKGEGRGVELGLPPFEKAQSIEAFRIQASPQITIVTSLVKTRNYTC